MVEQIIVLIMRLMRLIQEEPPLNICWDVRWTDFIQLNWFQNFKYRKKNYKIIQTWLCLKKKVNPQATKRAIGLEIAQRKETLFLTHTEESHKQPYCWVEAECDTKHRAHKHRAFNRPLLAEEALRDAAENTGLRFLSKSYFFQSCKSLEALTIYWCVSLSAVAFEAHQQILIVDRERSHSIGARTPTHTHSRRSQFLRYEKIREKVSHFERTIHILNLARQSSPLSRPQIETVCVCVCVWIELKIDSQPGEARIG